MTICIKTYSHDRRFVLYVNDEAVGYCKVKKNHKKHIVDVISIDNKHRRRGYASMLIRYLTTLWPNDLYVQRDYCTESGIKLFEYLQTKKLIEIIS